MAASIAPGLVTVDEYLCGDCRPDVDYVDGVLEDRNVGEFDHNALQMALARYFSAHRFEWGIRVIQKQRIRISETRYRVPDTCLISREAPIEQILTRPPLVCIEVLSPEDRIRRFQARVKDYLDMGVKNVWIIDPADKTAFNCASPAFSGWTQQTHFHVEGTPIEMDLEAVFREVD